MTINKPKEKAHPNLTDLRKVITSKASSQKKIKKMIDTFRPLLIVLSEK
ncbi:MAG: hypothetical protein QY314_03620 [Candidatus Dojkabacteria bacterium]|nr:MAG: hypothetical protein QY314_03620 [Candidatus Dojkabacteria bacterium]